jgi:hypothetical protein
MADFRILSNAATSGLKFADTVVNAHLGSAAGEAAELAISTEKGLINPLHLATFGELGGGIFRPEIFSHTTERVVHGTGTGALDEAVRSLMALGERHSVEGIHLAEDPAMYGLIMFKGDIGYVGGSPVTERIGKAAALEIDAAARRVMSFAT